MYKLSKDCYIDISILGKIWIEKFCWDDKNIFCYFLKGINKFTGKPMEIFSYSTYEEAYIHLNNIIKNM